MQYFGLGAVRLWAKVSQTVWDKILYLSSKFWEKLGFQQKMTKGTESDPASWVKNASRYFGDSVSHVVCFANSPPTDFPGFALQAPKKELRTIRYNSICKHFIQFSLLYSSCIQSSRCSTQWGDISDMSTPLSH